MKNKGVTLVSFVGTGMFEKSPADKGHYRETIYRFPDNTRSGKVSLFVEALLEKSDLGIQNVILIGTHTSSWDALVPDKDGENFALWDALNDSCSIKKTGLDDEGAKALEQCLVRKYSGINFSIIHHDDKLDEKNTEVVLGLYASVGKLIPQGSRLLLDITHGFRTMPLLLFQALQLYSPKFVPEEVNVVYGEYRSELKESEVRFFPNLWALSEIQRQVYAFKSTFDGDKLADSIDTFEKGSKLAEWIRTFSNMVKMNYVMQIGESIRQLRHILEKESRKSSFAWRNEVFRFLQEIEKKLDKKRLSEQLLVFGRLLFDHGLATQAIIALRVAVETRVAEVTKQGIGKYALWDVGGLGRSFLQDACKGDQALWEDMERLREARNLIAHAGGEKYKTPPKVQRIPFDVFEHAVQTLFMKEGMS